MLHGQRRPSPPLRFPVLQGLGARYSLALALFALALVARFALDRWLPPAGFPFLTFFPAVMLAALLTGLGPGLLVAALSVLAAKEFFFDPPGLMAGYSVPTIVALVFFGSVLVLDCVVIHVMTLSLRRIREERGQVAELSASQGVLTRELEARVEELRQREEELRAALAGGERTRAELAASEARFRSLAEALPTLLFVTSADGANTYTNRRFQDYVGMSGEALLGNGWIAALHPEDRGRAAGNWERAVASGQSYEAEYRFRRHDSAWRWFLVRGEPERDGDGRILRWTGTCTDIEDMRRAEVALIEGEARLRSVVETAADGILVADEQGKVVSANPAALHMFGYDDPGDLLGRDLGVLMPDEEAGRHGGYLRGHESEAGRAAPARAIAVPGRELLARRRDGTEFPIELSVASFTSGERRFFTGVVRDVTERRRADELRVTLAREVDHRAKNALAVALSLLRLTPRDDAGRFAASVEGRVAAMARAHSLLATHKWSGADLQTLAEGELAAHDGRVDLQGPAVRITSEAVQPVAMLLHELATNAAKYGALSHEGGRVSLSWGFDGGDASLRLRWKESGGPEIPGAPARRGFGSRLIASLVGQQLGGAVKYDWLPDGILCVIDLAPRFAAPADAVREAGGVRGRAPERQASRPDEEAAAESEPAAPSVPRVLIVEDEALLSMELETAVQDLGCEVVGPARTLAEALRLASTEPDLAAAVLDVNLGGGEFSFPVVDVLRTRGVPYLFSTGYGSTSSLGGHDGTAVAVLIKPYAKEALADAIAAARWRAEGKRAAEG
ncbi:PAS domain S-box protein [Muricoccus pecuniae]|uniref:histidine kinase n=1 Tax=Muricoccus pecuniae TaxID=693023 RepID=A0A840YAS7_9PROT|nr:PAS domain S-box protein [Roseomonas pecuniae]MBB5693151.1 PAS domain S-box-containing protein [Roseomonas pecuniae]